MANASDRSVTPVARRAPPVRPRESTFVGFCLHVSPTCPYVAHAAVEESPSTRPIATRSVNIGVLLSAETPASGAVTSSQILLSEL